MNKILFLDELTTGMNPQRCAIYSMGGILCEDTAGKITELERFELKIKPFEEAKIMNNSLWVGKTNRTDLMSFQPEEESLKAFTEILDRHVNVNNPNDKIFIAGFNASSVDVPFLKALFDRCGCTHFRDYFFYQTIDLMSIAAFALINERKGMANFHMLTVANYLDVQINENEEYNCLENADTYMEIYRKLKERLKTGEYGECTKTETITRNF